MTYKYKKHYTRDEARALLPQVRTWLEQLLRRREEFEKADRAVAGLVQSGADTGGGGTNDWVRRMADLREGLLEFERRGILIKDVDRGLVDFPALLGGKEVFLCWEKDEADIEYWHELDAGYGGREKL